MQFLLIIRTSSEDSIRAAYSTKVAQLVETYAQPAEYARTMGAVLVAAGNAAPKALASRISGTLALCGEQTVQANTATVFSQLLKGEDPLSDAQMLVCCHGLFIATYCCIMQQYVAVTGPAGSVEDCSSVASADCVLAARATFNLLTSVNMWRHQPKSERVRDVYR